MAQNPVDLFLGFAMQVWKQCQDNQKFFFLCLKDDISYIIYKEDCCIQGQLKQADTICQAFSLEKLHLLELAGDLR